MFPALVPGFRYIASISSIKCDINLYCQNTPTYEQKNNQDTWKIRNQKTVGPNISIGLVPIGRGCQSLISSLKLYIFMRASQTCVFGVFLWSYFLISIWFLTICLHSCNGAQFAWQFGSLNLEWGDCRSVFNKYAHFLPICKFPPKLHKLNVCTNLMCVQQILKCVYNKYLMRV